MKRLNPLYYLVFFVLFFGCKKLNRPEPIPSFLYVDNFQLTTDVGNEGENTDNIADGWVYIDGTLAGAYELPASVPILTPGKHSIQIIPGIMNSGISGQRKTYPFYTDFETTIVVAEDSVTSIIPQTEYQPNLDFEIEDFESAGIIFSEAGASDTNIVVKNGGPTGSYGSIILGPGQNYGLFETSANLILPQSGSRVYIELDYKSNNKFLVGVVSEAGASRTYHAVINVNKTNSSGTAVWNKIYIECTDIVSSQTNTNQFEVFLELGKDSDVTTTDISIDNFKLVHY